MELLRKASEAGEKAARKLEEWAAEMARAFAAWNELAGFASETAEEKPRPDISRGCPSGNAGRMSPEAGGLWIAWPKRISLPAEMLDADTNNRTEKSTA